MTFFDCRLHYLEQQEKKKVPMLMLDPKHVARDVPYYFGIDPVSSIFFR